MGRWPLVAAMRLRLYHHPDGARVAYREIGAGPPLALLHSAMLSHMEWEPAVEQLADRFRVVLPDLPLHGDSEDRPQLPLHARLVRRRARRVRAEVLGSRPLIGRTRHRRGDRCCTPLSAGGSPRRGSC